MTKRRAVRLALSIGLSLAAPTCCLSDDICLMDAGGPRCTSISDKEGLVTCNTHKGAECRLLMQEKARVGVIAVDLMEAYVLSVGKDDPRRRAIAASANPSDFARPEAGLALYLNVPVEAVQLRAAVFATTGAFAGSAGPALSVGGHVVSFTVTEAPGATAFKACVGQPGDPGSRKVCESRGPYPSACVLSLGKEHAQPSRYLVLVERRVLVSDMPRDEEGRPYATSLVPVGQSEPTTLDRIDTVHSSGGCE